MEMLRAAPYFLIGFLALTGCAGERIGFEGGGLTRTSYTGPENPPAKPVRFSLNGPVDEVTGRLVNALAGPRFGITHVDRNRGLITAVYRADPEDFVDCGLLNVVSSDGASNQVAAASRQLQYRVGLRNGNYGVVNRNLKLDGRMLIEVERYSLGRQSQVTVSGDYVLTRTLRVSGKPGDPSAVRKQLIDFGSGQVGGDDENKLKCQSNGELESYLLASLQTSEERGAAPTRGLSLGPADDADAPLLTRVRSQFEQLDCAPLNARSLGGSDVMVTGFVSSERDLERLESMIRGVPGIGDVIFRVNVTSPAFCEILDVTLPLKELNGVDQAGAFVRLTDGSFSLVEGDYLVVDATSPSYESYVYVFYAQQDGKLIHMLPNPQEPDNFLPAGRNFRIGGDSSARRYSVSAPFGDDMVTLIASSEPLFADPRPEVEPVTLLADDLADRVALVQSDGATVVADIVFVTTSPRSF